MPAGNFQVKLCGEWKDYKGSEDKILKRAFLAGFPNAKYKIRGQQYLVDFSNMKQTNVRTGKARDIRAPHKWTQPAKPIVQAGPTFCIKVPAGSPGSTIQVPHPKDKRQLITVNVPAGAKVGAAMLVPVPPLPSTPAVAAVATPARASEAAATAPVAAPAEEKKSGWSTGAKVAAGGAAVVGVGGLAVAGAVLGEHIAEEGWDATMAELGDAAADAGEAIAGAAEDAGEAIVGAAEDAGEWIAGAAEDAGEWISGVAEDAADFIMDLF
jgi:hypothetical protein